MMEGNQNTSSRQWPWLANHCTIIVTSELGVTGYRARCVWGTIAGRARTSPVLGAKENTAVDMWCCLWLKAVTTHDISESLLTFGHLLRQKPELHKEKQFPLLCFGTLSIILFFKTENVCFGLINLRWYLVSWTQSLELVPIAWHQHQHKIKQINKEQNKPSVN